MTREQANELLDLWRHGLATYSETTIKRALTATGDLVPSKVAKAQEKRAMRRAAPRHSVGIRTWRQPLAAGNSR